MDAEAAYHVQIEKLEDQLRSAAEVKVCKPYAAICVLMFSSVEKDLILLLSF